MQHNLYKVPAEAKSRAHIDNDRYLEMYQQSVDDPEAFWREQGQRISWFSAYNKVKTPVLRRAISASSGLRMAP